MIQHVSLEVPPPLIPAATAFYELIGFTEVQPPDALAERVVWLQGGSTQVHLMKEDDAVQLPRGHFAVVARDYDATLERLRNAGFDPEPRTEHWGAARSFVRDPAGNRVELMAAPPP